MANIDKELNQIKHAVYGREVRGSIHDGIEKINKESQGSRQIANNTEQRQDAIQQQFDTLLGEWSDDKPIDNAETIAARTNTKESKTYDNLGKRLDEEFGKVTSQLADIVLNVKDFGATGDGETDDSKSIITAIDKTPSGGKLLFPAGEFLTTEPIIINKNINVEMRGAIISGHDDDCFVLDELGRGTNLIPNFIIKVKKKHINHELNSVGVSIKNTYGLKIQIDLATGFTTNIKLESFAGKGTVYNELSLGQIQNGKTQIHLTAAADGWTNQNTFLGGRLYYSPLDSRDDYIQIKIDGSLDDYPLYRNNGNMFINTSLEDVGNNKKYAKAIVCGGIYNNFTGIRVEGSLDWLFTSSSYRNLVNGGTYVSMSKITDDGKFNTFLTQGTGGRFVTQTVETSFDFVAGANNTVGARFYGYGSNRVPARFFNSGSPGYPALQIMESDGETVAGEICANGLWVVRGGTRKIAFGLYPAGPTSGSWRRGDISFVSYPVAGKPVGFVCISGDGSDSGVWVPFGGQATKQNDSTAESVTDLRNHFNALLNRLKLAGIMAE